jgi:hypothetical protein
VLVSIMAVGARLEALLSIGPKVAMVPTDCGCGAIPGVRSVARTAVPGARAADYSTKGNWGLWSLGQKLICLALRFATW